MAIRTYRPSVRDQQRRHALAKALLGDRRHVQRRAIPDNSEPWTARCPNSVEEAIAVSDRVDALVRAWGLR